MREQARSTRKADNLTALSGKCGFLDVSQPYRPSRSLNRDSFTLLFHCYYMITAMGCVAYFEVLT
jgi:hypothetical protein